MMLDDGTILLEDVAKSGQRTILCKDEVVYIIGDLRLSYDEFQEFAQKNGSMVVNLVLPRGVSRADGTSETIMEIIPVYLRKRCLLSCTWWQQHYDV